MTVAAAQTPLVFGAGFSGAIEEVFLKNVSTENRRAYMYSDDNRILGTHLIGKNQSQFRNCKTPISWSIATPTRTPSRLRACTRAYHHRRRIRHRHRHHYAGTSVDISYMRVVNHETTNCAGHSCTPRASTLMNIRNVQFGGCAVQTSRTARAGRCSRRR